MANSKDHGRLSEISAEKMCECPFSIAQQYIESYLKEAEAGGTAAVIHLPLATPIISFGRKVAMTFSLAPDETEPGRSHDEVLVRWNSGVPLLPDFRGSIRYRIAGLRTLVRIDVVYKPPLGTLGAMFDRIIGKWLATRTINDLLRRIKTRLEKQQSEWLRLQSA